MSIFATFYDFSIQFFFLHFRFHVAPDRMRGHFRKKSPDGAQTGKTLEKGEIAEKLKIQAEFAGF